MQRGKMKPEISFLMDLFLDEEVPAPIKKKLANRMREVEKYLITPHSGYLKTTSHQPTTTGHIITNNGSPIISTQSPSMQRIMEHNQDLIPKPPIPTTKEAAEALNQRQKIMLGAANEKPEPGRTSPRKF